MPLSHNFTASPPNHQGFWSPQTSAVNFCEIDYAITPYLAEFINSLTNLAYVYFAFTTLPSASPSFELLSWPTTNISLLLVGLGSFSFHATLRHTAQIADELAMYAIISSLNYAVYTTGPIASSLTTPMSRTVLAASLLSGTGIVGYLNYTNQSHYQSNFDIHTTLFIVLLTTFWPRILYLINHSTAKPLPPGTSSTPLSSQKSTHRKRLLTFRLAALSFLLGFGIWLLDGLYCHSLRNIRSTIHSYLGLAGLPFEWILEFHGVWHVLTAIGAGMFVRLVGELRDGYESREVNGGRKREGELGNGKAVDGSVLARKRTPTLPGLDAVGSSVG